MILRLPTGKETTVDPVSAPLRIRCRQISFKSALEYRSAIFYNSPAQKDVAQKVTEEVQKKHFDPNGKKVVTEILEGGKWFDAEEYHQQYLIKNPTGYHCYTHKLHW